MPFRPPSLRQRFLGVLAAWLCAFLASPGVLTGDGSALLAVVAVALWGAFVVRPLGERRRRALLVEWLAGTIGWGLLVWWVWYVVPLGVLYMGGAWGLYAVLGGALVRALARGLSPGVAVAVGWLGIETARTILDPPFGLGWLRLGHYAHHHIWLAGSARIWGVEGLTFVLAALGGAGAELLATRRVGRGALGLAAAALALGIGLSLATSPPATVDGPRLLLVQPGFPQAVKQYSPAEQNFDASCALTFRGLEEARARGEPEIDLVCWGETMLYLQLLAPEAIEALRQGTLPPPWIKPLGAREIRSAEVREERWVRGRVFGFGRSQGQKLAQGTSFLAGAELLDLVDGELRRRVAVVLYDARGVRSRAAGKRYLVPGAETMYGFERFEVVRDVVTAIAGYVPDFVSTKTTGVLELATRDGRTFHIGATACFDNAFLAPYTEPVAAGPLDFHLVASNEAWYRESCELDQMIAFSRLIALATGRSIVRATNSGISVAIGPDGSELGRVSVGGRDRSVPGTLRVTVPVPAEPTGRGPFYARHRSLVRLAVGLACLAALLLPAMRRRSGNRAPSTG